MTYEEIRGNDKQPSSKRMFHCALCEKEFYIEYPTEYTYKIRNRNHKMRYSCCYTCHAKVKEIITGRKD